MRTLAVRSAGRLAAMARWRNLLVQRYPDVDAAPVWEIVTGDLADLVAFLAHMAGRLEAWGGRRVAVTAARSRVGHGQPAAALGTSGTRGRACCLEPPLIAMRPIRSDAAPSAWLLTVDGRCWARVADLIRTGGGARIR